VLAEILEERAVSSRDRRNKRGVKRKMSNFPIRRRGETLDPPRVHVACRIVGGD
jgi:hypothetical protein